MKLQVKKRYYLFLSAALVVSGVGIAGLGSEASAACGDSGGAGVDWRDCRKSNLMLTDSDFSKANFSRADMSSSDLRRTVLNETQFEKTNLIRASLRGSKARNANFIGVTASRTDFRDMDLSGSNFSKSEIIRSDFSNSILANVNMSKSALLRAKFQGADLNKVDFSFASLARADFRGAMLDGDNTFDSAFFYRTHIEGVDLSQVTGIVQWQMNMACGDEKTKLPEGIKRPASWPCGSDAAE